jgi:hypothetical protein
MAEYQNIFTRVQVRGPAHHGVPVPRGPWVREGIPGFSHLLGELGNAQVGPIYLGTLGLASILAGFIAIEIIGLNMWASVGWNPILFVRDLPWLALEPPSPAYGLRILPDQLADPVVSQNPSPRHPAWARHPYGLGLCIRHLVISLPGLLPADFDGGLGRSPALWYLSTSGLDRGVFVAVRQLVLRSLSHALHRLSLWVGIAVCDACRNYPRGQPFRRR